VTIELEHVTRFNGIGGIAPHCVLDDVTFTFPSGRTTGILGLRGSGKTTLIRLLAGTLPPTGGRIRRRGLVSFPIGSFGWMHRHMTGRENLHFLARIYGLDARPIIDFVAAVSGLGAALEMPVQSYSGEKRARLSFSACYAIPFDVYLADEFLIGGPPGFRDVCRTMARERQQGATFILATRSPALIRLFCDTACILDGGSIRMCATVHDAVAEHAALNEAAAAHEPDDGEQNHDPGFWTEDVSHAA
jgi:capsular polysaccharide transport system ATP-binding protein